eukprot:gene6994-14223_t
MNKKNIKADVVTDEQGRRRFHGAFTGGFSAGYFNTVGSEEGWKPTSFQSSRSKREEKKSQNIQDYMDNEDGLLGGTLSTNKEFDSFGKKSLDIATKAAENQTHTSAIPGSMPSELIIASTKPIGKQLMAKMNWKEGQGVGPRVRHKKGSLPVHESVNIATISSGAFDEGHITFAPNNISDLIKIPAPKSDLYGIGYDPAIHNAELHAFRHRYNESSHSNSKQIYRMNTILTNNNIHSLTTTGVSSRGTSGFAMNDEDDDVYDSNTISSFSNTAVEVDVDVDLNNIHTSTSNKSNKLHDILHDWSADANTLKTTSSSKTRGSDGLFALPGFRFCGDNNTSTSAGTPGSTSITTMKESMDSPTTVIVPDSDSNSNISFGIANGEDIVLQQTPTTTTAIPTIPDKATAITTGITATTTTTAPSVFDLLGDAAKSQIQRALTGSNHRKSSGDSTAKITTKITSTSTTTTTATTNTIESSLQSPLSTATTSTAATSTVALPQEDENRDRRPMLAPHSQSLLKTTFSGLSEAFKGRFTSSTASNNIENSGSKMTVIGGITTADDLKKKYESTSTLNVNVKSVVEPVTSKLKIGSVSRVSRVWAPAPLLCKRFNVRVPESSSNLPRQHMALQKQIEEEKVKRDHIKFDKHIGQFLPQTTDMLTVGMMYNTKNRDNDNNDNDVDDDEDRNNNGVLSIFNSNTTDNYTTTSTTNTINSSSSTSKDRVEEEEYIPEDIRRPKENKPSSSSLSLTSTTSSPSLSLSVTTTTNTTSLNKDMNFTSAITTNKTAVTDENEMSMEESRIIFRKPISISSSTITSGSGSGSSIGIVSFKNNRYRTSRRDGKSLSMSNSSGTGNGMVTGNKRKILTTIVLDNDDNDNDNNLDDLFDGANDHSGIIINKDNKHKHKHKKEKDKSSHKKHKKKDHKKDKTSKKMKMKKDKKRKRSSSSSSSSSDSDSSSTSKEYL